MANLRVDKITSTETFETTGSVQFDGNSDYLETDKAPFQMLHKLTSSWTIESWIYLENPGAQLTVFDTGGSSNTTIGLSVYIDSQIKFRLRQALSSLDVSISIDHTMSYSSWHHFSATFDYDTKSIRIFVDGKIVGSATYGTESSTDSNKNFKIGAYEFSTDTIAGYLQGYVSNMRVIDGTALYTSNFKPSMRELEVVPGTVLLACQSKTDATLEKTGKTLTANGTAVASELTPGILTPVPKAGGGSAITGSVEFDGTGDYLTSADNSDFAMGTGDLTIESWIYASDNADYRTIFDTSSSGQGGSNSNGIRFGVDNSGSAYIYTNGFLVTASSAITEGCWNHVAYTRSSGTHKLFVNGVERASSTTARDYTNDSCNIGTDQGNSELWKGYISNLRVIKGTALYTDDFIPPTRELKKVPGTVLLCCQDPDNPLTEATGKAITPYGSLGDGSLGPELVTSDGVWTLTKGGSGATDWTVSNNGSSLAGTTVTSGFIRATYTLDEGDYLVSLRWTGGAFAVQDSTGYITTTSGIDTDFATDEDGAYSFYMSNTTSVVITGTAWNTAYTVDDISIKRIYKNNGGSNFTPQVGDDRKVTFEGVAKVNTDAYFYLPTGDTESRYPIGSGGAGAGTRGVMFGGYYDSSPNRSDVIDYVTIASTGNAVDFGDRLNTTDTCAACASATRALNAGGYDGSATINTIEYVTIASTGNASKFGELDLARRNRDGCSSSTRGLFGGGYPTDDAMEYVTIATSGISSLFGNLTVSRYNLGALASPVRGVFGGGTPSTDTMDFVTIATTADAIDFGNLTAANGNVAGTSSETRGIFGFSNNVINYITIASTGDAIDFGDLNYNPNANACTSSLIRGIFMGGGTPARVNTISYITIASTGNAVDFGDLTQARQSLSATSSGHGGLG